MLKIAPSILSADFGHLADEIRKVEEAGADMLHLDVMDGHFVPNLSIGPIVIQSIRGRSNLPFETHLMVEEPDLFIGAFADAGTDLLTIHADNVHRLFNTIHLVKKLGKKVGVALCPISSLDILEYILQDVDLILQMTVEPGFGGQPFMPGILPKIREIKKLIDKKGLHLDIAVDGGINERTAPQVIEAGANILVMGSAVFGKKSPKELKAMFQTIRALG
jgi:ribulose-phosphate 3-epimerase